MIKGQRKVSALDVISACNQVQAAMFVCMGQWIGEIEKSHEENLIELEDLSDSLRKMVIKFCKQERES